MAGENVGCFLLCQGSSNCCPPQKIHQFPGAQRSNENPRSGWFQHCHLILPWKSGWQGEKGRIGFLRCQGSSRTAARPRIAERSGGEPSARLSSSASSLAPQHPLPSLTSVLEPSSAPAVCGEVPSIILTITHLRLMGIPGKQRFCDEGGLFCAWAAPFVVSSTHGDDLASKLGWRHIWRLSPRILDRKRRKKFFFVVT